MLYVYIHLYTIGMYCGVCNIYVYYIAIHYMYLYNTYVYTLYIHVVCMMPIHYICL